MSVVLTVAGSTDAGISGGGGGGGATDFSGLTGQATLAQLPTIATLTFLANLTGLSAVPTAATLADNLVTAFNGRVGAVTQASGDVTTALGYTPADPGNTRTWTAKQTFSAAADITGGTFVSITSINKVAITPPATSATLTIADGKTLTASNTLTFAGTDGSTLNVGAGGTLGTMATQAASAVAITGGTIAGLTGLAVRDTSAAFDVTIAATATSATLTAGRTLTLDMGNVAHTLALGTTAGTITFPNTAAMTVARIDAAQTFAGVQTFGVGSAATPSLVVGDATTGMYSVSTTGLGLTVHGVSKADFGITAGTTWTFVGDIKGTGNLILPSSGNVNFGGAGGTAYSYIYNQGDGILQLGDHNGAGNPILRFGGSTSSFPAIKRSATILQARLADDSNFAPLQGLLQTAANAVAGTITPDHTIVITDAAGQAYRVPCQV